MDSLPKCTESFEPSKEELELISTLTSYDKICEFLQNYIGADCWAVTANDEVLFNIYEQKTSFRQRIEDAVIRDHLTKNIHAYLLVYVLGMKTQFVLNIYIFERDSYRLQVTYKPENDISKGFDFKYFK